MPLPPRIESSPASLPNGPFDLFGQFENLQSGSSAQVHQDQRLLIMDSGLSHPLSLPAAALDHPAGSQFELIVTLGVIGKIGKPLAQAGKRVAVNHRIFEKTACIADLGGIWQFFLTNGDDGLTDMIQRYRSDRFRGRFYTGIIENEVRLQTELEDHRRDDELSGPLAFEFAGPVSESAFVWRNKDLLTVVYGNGFDTVDHPLDLHAVSTDVLDRAGADAARDERKVFDTGPTIGNGIRHQIIPVLTGLGPDPEVLTVCFNHMDPPQQRVQHHAVKIIHEQQVAAPAEDQQTMTVECIPTEKIDNLVFGIKTNIAGGGSLDLECIESFERKIRFQFHNYQRHKNKSGLREIPSTLVVVFINTATKR